MNRSTLADRCEQLADQALLDRRVLDEVAFRQAAWFLRRQEQWPPVWLQWTT